ncbi:MAG: hypothetical protein Q7U54_12495 [Bacteroidales bacterium]|nr:hypothetical protein [Bacteroidales bacterium]
MAKNYQPGKDCRRNDISRVSVEEIIEVYCTMERITFGENSSGGSRVVNWVILVKFPV